MAKNTVSPLTPATTTSAHERAILHKSIWDIANDLRGAVSGWDFRCYVLGTMAYRYLSENLAGYINEQEHDAGNTDFDYAHTDDALCVDLKDDIVQEKGYFILPSQLFENIVYGCDDDADLNQTLKEAFDAFESSVSGTKGEVMFSGIFSDIDLNSNQLGPDTGTRNSRLRKVLHGIAKMPLGTYMEDRVGSYGDNKIDLFGDAYEYLISMYAANAGKSGGEFFTPPEVSELLARIVSQGKTKLDRCYDPTCGSGGLLLKFSKVLGEENILGFFGQEINVATYNLCRINMILHGINYTKLNIFCGDTLAHPDPRLKEMEPFDGIASNPPYSIRWAGSDNPDFLQDDRFTPAGVLAPKGRADLAFVMHCLKWLRSDGKAAIVCFPGVMYRRGAEQKIRKYLVDSNFVEAVIQLPEKLFYGTSIATSILVLAKNKTESKTLFIDASEEFVTGPNQNRLSEENIEHLMRTLSNKDSVSGFCQMVDNSEIAEQDYILSVGIYVQKDTQNMPVNIDELNRDISRTVQREEILRHEIENILFSLKGCDVA